MLELADCLSINYIPDVQLAAARKESTIAVVHQRRSPLIAPNGSHFNGVSMGIVHIPPLIFTTVERLIDDEPRHYARISDLPSDSPQVCTLEINL